ncbi:MAG: formyltransferase family protein [Patescibacteria group bacterium]|nr:formyltransferase family protein [Patescibacteria group bacterium]
MNRPKNRKPRILVLASGGGSGFEKLVTESRLRNGDLDADIVGVACNVPKAGVCQRADRLQVSLALLPSIPSTSDYEALVEEFKPDLVACSGYLRLISGIAPEMMINIHPALLPRFGGQGMHGHYAHAAVINAAAADPSIKHSGVSMHFVDEAYDHGQLFCRFLVGILEGDDADSLGLRVNQREHLIQPFLTNLVAHGHIRLSPTGRVIVPSWYKLTPFCPIELV